MSFFNSKVFVHKKEFIANNVQYGAGGFFSRGNAGQYSATYASIVIDDSPVFYWQCNEPSGASILNESIVSNVCSFAGNVSTGASSLIYDSGYSLNFPDATGRAVSGIVSVMSSTNFAVEGWIKFNSSPSGAGIISRWDSSNIGQQSWLVAEQSGGIRFYFRSVSGGVLSVDTSTAVNDGNAHHVVVLVKPASNNGVQIFVDGQRNGTYTSSVTDVQISFVPIVLGAYYNGVTYFSGMIDEVAIYNSAISSSSVREHYRKGSGFSPKNISDCRCWLDSNQLSQYSSGAIVSTWTDYSGNNSNGTLAAGSAIYASGVVNGNPALRLPANAYFTFPSALTSGITEGEAFVVTYISSDPPSDSNKTGLWDFGNASLGTNYPYTDGDLYEDFGMSSRPGPFNIGNLNQWRVYNVKSAANSWEARLDASVITSSTTNTVSFPSLPELGRSQTYYMDGYIAEFIFYASALSEKDRNDITYYLADKYGINI